MTTKYTQIINKMIWIGDKTESNSEVEEEKLKIFPFVTVSRDPGSGGKPIAKLLAKKLGFKFYDKQLIDKIAKSVDARKEILAQIDEKQRHRIEDVVHSILNPEYVSERRYIKHLCKVVLSLANEKSAVFLGRGTNFILPSQNGLNIRVTAPYRVCVSRAVEYENVSHTKARSIIKKVTSEREAFVQQYFGKDINKPKYYDITLNTTYFNLNQSTEVLEKTFKQKFL